MSTKDKIHATEQKPAPAPAAAATQAPELTEEQLAEVAGGIIIVSGRISPPVN